MAKRVTHEKIKKIKLLRKKGWSLPEIVSEVHVGYGTAYRYIKDVKMDDKYLKTWRGKWGGSIKRMKAAEERAYLKAKETIDRLSGKERLIFAVALYWGEGNKKDFGLTNSDPELIRVFVWSLENLFSIDKNRLRVSIRIFEDMNRAKCLDYWSKIIGLPVEKFVNVDILRGKKKGKLKYGICRVRILKGGDVLKYLVALKKVIVENFEPS